FTGFFGLFYFLCFTCQITAADIILAVWHTLLLKSLKQIDGYPAFSEIFIKYERFSEKKSGM
ncbi:MAG: hypothetical protein OSJ43_11885, partial [Oscillospiraceae bacterium]|nr:hypothetical protein [Oscillospiraceae bacterium]